MNEIVRLENVHKHYPLGEIRVQALTDVSISVEAGVIFAIVGPSGSGKSTLLNLIGHIDMADQGRVIVAGRDITGKSPDVLADVRARTVGFIFPTFNLLAALTLEENVEYPLLRLWEIGRKERKRRVADLIESVDLARFAGHYPSQLSACQQKRAVIARALVMRPRILLADELTSRLDHETREAIFALLKETIKTTGTTLILSTHDQKAIDFADCYIGLENGQLRYIGLRKDGHWAVRDEKPQAHGS